MDVRVGNGGGESKQTCTEDAYDNSPRVGKGACKKYLQTNGAERVCSSVMSPSGKYAHYCDASCHFLCTQEITATLLAVLPPGTTKTMQAVAINTANCADKGFAFTAAVTGTFNVRVGAYRGEGRIAVGVSAIGTALQRAPAANLAGQWMHVHLGCSMTACAFEYNGAAVLDGDGRGFELRTQVPVAGTAVAIQIGLACREFSCRHTGVQARLTMFVPGTTAGAAAFQPAINGALGGPWTKTASGHRSYAQFKGCKNTDAACVSALRISGFGVHPGGERFTHRLQATAVIPTAAPVLFRLELNCDVPFFADVELPTCYIKGGANNCNNPVYRTCATDVTLALTAGAHIEGDKPVRGLVTQKDTIVLSRSELEAQATRMFHSAPAVYPKLHVPITIETLQDHSEGQALLTRMFGSRQSPHQVSPIRFVHTTQNSELDAQAARMFGGLNITLKASAPSTTEANHATMHLVNLIRPSSASSELEAQAARMLHGSQSVAQLCGLGSTAASCTRSGEVHSITVVSVSRSELEAQAARMFHATPSKTRCVVCQPELSLLAKINY